MLTPDSTGISIMTEEFISRDGPFFREDFVKSKTGGEPKCNWAVSLSDEDDGHSTDDDFINFPFYDNNRKGVENECVRLGLDHLIRNAVITLDDIKMQQYPTQDVDYLCYSWREEDIGASWKHVVSRRDLYNSPRLENASWRTWAKLRAKLPTVSPESIKW